MLMCISLLYYGGRSIFILDLDIYITCYCVLATENCNNNPPPQSSPQTPPMTSIVKLTAENGETFHFPTAFLRENLKESIDKSSLQRVSLIYQYH